MGRLLTITMVAVLVVAVWAILVAPNVDLGPTVLRGKQIVACGGFAALLLPVLACAVMMGALRSSKHAATLPFLSLLELTCARLC